ncbi:peptide-binding protein [candidate division CSSED10-310 bacterium]|uniref:Peptide-binding protein n=1 Tax=candidate division CSSED10-310 bacterium TaxID=2855610 RepID=A0ABV6Z687_UNCC1
MSSKSIFSTSFIRLSLIHKPVFLLALIFLITASFWGLDFSISSTVQASESDVLIRELHSDPQFLNPVLTDDYPSQLVERLIFDPLIDIDGSPESNPVGRLAEKWAVSEDKLAITFFLRQNITWHDGKQFSADDVKFTFDIAMMKEIPAVGMKSTVDTLRKVEVTDPHTVIFHFKHPFSPGLLGVGRKLIVPKHLLDAGGLANESSQKKSSVTFVTTDFNQNPVGTGPYTVQQWQKGQHIKLGRNEEYWDKKHLPQIKTILIKIVRSRQHGFTMVAKGDLDIFNTLPEQYLQFQKVSKLQQKLVDEKFYEPAYYFIAWNVRPEKLFFSDKQVRQAMTYATDRETFLKNAEAGLGQIVTGPFYFKSWAYNHSLKPYPFDLKKAAELLDSAGWQDRDGDGIRDKEGVPFTFELLIASGRPRYKNMATILQDNLKKLSVELFISEVEWSTYLERLNKGQFYAYVGGWSMGVDPDPYMKWHSSQIYRGANNIGYENDEVDTLLEQARSEYDRQKRIKAYWRIHEIIHDEQPHTFIHTPMEIYIMSKKIKNYQISPFGFYEFFPGTLTWTVE